MRTVAWLAGVVLGAFAGVAVLVAGSMALIVLVPAGVWAAREWARPVGAGGFLVGLGAGPAGMAALANARCAASNFSGPNFVSECVAPDLTAFFVAAAALVLTGILVSLVAVARPHPPTAR